MGLDVPAAVQLAQALRARGLPVPEDIYRMDALRAWIDARYRGEEVAP